MTDAKNEADSGASRSDAVLAVEFVTDPDELGRGRVIVNGRYFALPMEAVLEYKVLRDLALYLQESIAKAAPSATAANA